MRPGAKNPEPQTPMNPAQTNSAPQPPGFDPQALAGETEAALGCLQIHPGMAWSLMHAVILKACSLDKASCYSTPESTASGIETALAPLCSKAPVWVCPDACDWQFYEHRNSSLAWIVRNNRADMFEKIFKTAEPALAKNLLGPHLDDLLAPSAEPNPRRGAILSCCADIGLIPKTSKRANQAMAAGAFELAKAIKKPTLGMFGEFLDEHARQIRISHCAVYMDVLAQALADADAGKKIAERQIQDFFSPANIQARMGQIADEVLAPIFLKGMQSSAAKAAFYDSSDSWINLLPQAAQRPELLSALLGSASDAQLARARSRVYARFPGLPEARHATQSLLRQGLTLAEGAMLSGAAESLQLLARLGFPLPGAQKAAAMAAEASATEFGARRAKAGLAAFEALALGASAAPAAPAKGPRL